MKKFKWLRVLITIIVVILGVSAIGWFTWNLGKMFIKFVSESPVATQEPIEVPKNEILSLKEIKIWTCQVGVFKEKKNAENMINSLRTKGWKAGIIKEDPYTVGIGLFSSKEQAAQLGKTLAENGMNTWIREESFPALHYKVSGKNVEKVCLNLKIANSLLDGTERSQVTTELAGDIEFLFSGEYPPDFQKLNDILFQVLSTKNSSETGLDTRYHQDLLELFIEYRLIATKYLKNYK